MVIVTQVVIGYRSEGCSEVLEYFVDLITSNLAAAVLAFAGALVGVWQVAQQRGIEDLLRSNMYAIDSLGAEIRRLRAEIRRLSEKLDRGESEVGSEKIDIPPIDAEETSAASGVKISLPSAELVVGGVFLFIVIFVLLFLIFVGAFARW